MLVSTLQLFVLIAVANGAPPLVRTLLGSRGDYPLDCHKNFLDNQRVFGDSKTWRGLFSSMIATPVVAVVVGKSLGLGLIVALGAMLGDLCSSFIKRRFELAAGHKVLLLDQIPEALFPGLLVWLLYDFAPSTIVIAVGLFVLFDVLVSPLLFKWGVREKPH